MLKLTHRASGRHFLQIPGPTHVPERVLRAIDNPTIDHRGPEFQIIVKKVLSDIKKCSRPMARWLFTALRVLAPGRRHWSTPCRLATRGGNELSDFKNLIEETSMKLTNLKFFTRTALLPLAGALLACTIAAPAQADLEKYHE